MAVCVYALHMTKVISYYHLTVDGIMSGFVIFVKSYISPLPNVFVFFLVTVIGLDKLTTDKHRALVTI